MLNLWMAALAAVIGVGVCGAGCGGAQGSGGVPSQSQGDRPMLQMLPALLTAHSAWSGKPRAATVRVWVDQEYRAQDPRWKDDLDDDIAYANRVLIPMLGVGLVAEYRAWDHRAQGELGAELTALVQTDPGDDAMWVIGVIAGTAGDGASFDQLGTAQLGHIVIRGTSEGELRKQLDRDFPQASADDRKSAAGGRRMHRLTTALLHQLAHSLGAQHETAADQLMSPRYSPAVNAAISDGDRKRMLSALDDRLAAAKHYHEAERLLTAGDAAGAANALAPVMQLYPARFKPRVLHCQIELAKSGAQDPAANAACDAALVSPEAAVAVAAAYRGLNAVTRAEDSLAKASAGTADHGIAAWAATTRARYGIPRDGTRWNLTVDDEPAAVMGVRNAISLVNNSDWDAATRAIDDAERRWPGLPGALTARCALEFRRDAIAAARRTCERALAQGGSSWALYLLGSMELESSPRAAAAGVAHLKQAITSDPDLTQAWHKLARVFKTTKATAELDQLRHDYQARFGESLTD